MRINGKEVRYEGVYGMEYDANGEPDGSFSLVRDADGSEHVTGPAEYVRKAPTRETLLKCALIWLSDHEQPTAAEVMKTAEGLVKAFLPVEEFERTSQWIVGQVSLRRKVAL